jgi:sugar lactone lactonase YvrE
MNKYIVLSIIFCLLGYLSSIQAQTITTVAGTGVRGYGGDGGQAATSELYGPTGIATDAGGNIFVNDIRTSRIRKIDAAGIITTIAGNAVPGYSGDGGPASAAQLNQPNSIAIDGRGNLYIDDGSYYNIRKIDASGVISSFAGNITSHGFSGDGGPATAALFSSTDGGIATDRAGNVYFCDQNNYRVRKIDLTGVITTFAGSGPIWPAPSGNTGDGGPATNAQLFPNHIAIDTAGNVFISDGQHYVIRKIDKAGIISTYAGNDTSGFKGDGGPATAAELSNVGQLVVDTTGSLFINDDGSRIRRVNSAGIITTIAGNGTPGFYGDGGPATACEFFGMAGLALNRTCWENIYIADANNSRIRRISYDDPPAFNNGHIQSLSVCGKKGAAGINSLLPISDIDAGQNETWSPGLLPLHGTAVVSYSLTATGGSLTPGGLTYTASTDYAGKDTFSVVIKDCCGYADTTTIYVTIDTLLPNPGTISGSDSICIGATTITLSDTVSGGLWSKSNLCAGVTGNVVFGLTSGTDTIYYIVSNACGNDSASHTVVVGDCEAGVNTPAYGKTSGQADKVTVFPNPNDGAFVINVLSGTDEEVRIVVTNMMGERVKELTVRSNEAVPVAIKGGAGIYFLSAVSAGGVWTEKIVVSSGK